MSEVSLDPIPLRARTVRRRAGLLTAVVSAACVPLLLVAGAGTWFAPGLLLLGAVVVFFELRPVHVGVAGERHSFMLTEGPLVAALAVSPGRPVVVALTGGVLLAQLLRGLPRYKTAFNTVQFCAAAAAASATAQVVPGTTGVILGLLVFLVVNDGLVRLVIAATTGQPIGALLGQAHLGWSLHIAAVSSVALIGAHMGAVDPATLPAFVPPLLLLLWSQEQGNKQTAQTTIATALASQATAFYGRSSEETVLLLARTARQVLAADRTEMVLLGEQAIVLLSSDGTDVERTQLDHHDLITGWRGQVLESITACGEGSWAGAVVGRDLPQALIRVRRDRAQEVFRTVDLALLQTLVDSMDGWAPADETSSTSMAALRRTVLDLDGPDARGMSDALGRLGAIRRRLESKQGRPEAVAADLQEVEDDITSFLSAFIAEPRRDEEALLVRLGQWEGSA